VDNLEDTVHHAYGLMPNMSWVLDRGQRNGPRAFTEFKRAEEIWAERARR